MQSSRPRPLYLGFSSQKGGVGKSTLAEILSSMLYYEEGISLFVVDCDLTQDSFFKLREREKGTIGEDPALTAYMQAYFHKLQRRSYRIIKARPQEALAQAEALVAKYPEEGYQWLSLTSLVMQGRGSFLSSRWRWIISSRPWSLISSRWLLA